MKAYTHRKHYFSLPLLLAIGLIFCGFKAAYEYFVPPAGTGTLFGVYSVPQNPYTDPVSFRVICAKNLNAQCYRDGFQIYGSKKKTMTGYGLPVLLNVNLVAPGSGGRTGFAQSEATYDAGLAAALDACNGINPAVMVIENEYNNANYFNLSAKDYIRQLGWACSYYRKRGIPVADGGTVMPALQYLVKQSLMAKDARTGQLKATPASDAYSQRIGGIGGATVIRAAGILDSVLQVADSIGLSYVNFHRYAHNAADSTAILQEIAYLHTRTKLPLICNECGQDLYDTKPATVTAIKYAFTKGGIVFAAWFNGNSSTGVRARALSKADGTNLPNGDEFAKPLNTK